MKANLAPNKKQCKKTGEKANLCIVCYTLLDLTTEFDDMLKNSEIWCLENLETIYILGHFPKIISHHCAILQKKNP
jgi:hypothetical protein